MRAHGLTVVICGRVVPSTYCDRVQPSDGCERVERFSPVLRRTGSPTWAQMCGSTVAGIEKARLSLFLSTVDEST